MLCMPYVRSKYAAHCSEARSASASAKVSESCGGLAHEAGRRPVHAMKTLKLVAEMFRTTSV